MYQCDLFWIQLLWLRQFEATQGRRDDCWWLHWSKDLPCSSVALMVEYEAVMTRSQHLVASKLSAEDVGILLDAVASVGEPVRPVFLWRPSLRDADDDMVLEVAVNGQADAIVTFNRRDFRPATERLGLKSCCPARRSNDWEEYHEEE
jgi:hypothetical protein